MKNMIAVIFGLGVIAAPWLGFARPEDPPPFPRRLVSTWVNKTCSGTCGTFYTICPGKVMCVFAAVGDFNASPFAPAVVPCEDYTSGTGTCNATAQCTGGTYVGSSSSVTVQVQNCPLTNCP